MKKIIAIVLAAMMLLSITACGGKSAAAPINSVEDLKGKKIGVQLGTTGDIYASDIEGATVEQYNKGFEAVQALSQGKIDAVIIDDQVAFALAEGNDKVKVLEEPFTVEDYAICLAKENKDLTADMNKAIAEIKSSGLLDEIFDKYINKNPDAKGYEYKGDGTKGTLVMGTNAEFPPYEYHEGDAIIGIDVEIVQAICDKLGYQLKIEDMAFDAIIGAVQSGKVDFGASGFTVTEDRLKSIDFTDSYCTASQLVIVRK